MSKADELREKARRLQQQQTAPPAPTTKDPVSETETESAAPVRRAPKAADSRTPTTTPAAPAAPKAQPIRSTIDLPPARHAAMKAWCGETAVELGISRVTTQDLVRTLVQRVLTDETLARKIRADLRKDLTT